MTTYLEQIPRDITNFMKPYVEGDLPTYRAIATEIFTKVIENKFLGFAKVQLLNRDAVINFFTEQLSNHFGPDLVPANIVEDRRKMTPEDIENYYFCNLEDLVVRILEVFSFMCYFHTGLINIPPVTYSVTKGIIQDRVLNRLNDLGYHPGAPFIIHIIKCDRNAYTDGTHQILPSMTVRDVLNLVGRSSLVVDGKLIASHVTMKELGIKTGASIYCT